MHLLVSAYFVISTLGYSPALLAQSPGGVSANLTLWIKANAGTTPSAANGNLTAWTNQVSGAGTSSVVINGSPDFSISTLCNFNPTVVFTKSNAAANGGDYITLGGDKLIRSLYATVKLAETNRLNTHITTWQNITTTAPAENTIHGGGSGSNAQYMQTGYDADFTGASVWRQNGNTTTNTQNYSGNFELVSALGSGTARVDAILGHQNSASGFDPSPRDWVGPVCEYVLYTGTQTANERNQVESYMGIKYGLSLGHDYLSSGATAVWSTTTNSSYNNMIIGIARDDNSGLLQKQSKSEMVPGDVLTAYIGTKNALNSGNTGTFTGGNNSFFMVGNNNAAVINTTYPHPERPAGICCRLQREWLVQKTNFTNATVNLEFNLTGLGAGTINMANLRLLVDADGNFTNATVLATSATTISVSGSVVTVTVDPAQFTANPYFTLGSVSSATPLPIELLYFDAEGEDGRRVKLSWQTASEINNDYFTVERSRDAMTWEELGRVAGAGNSTATRSYGLYDERPYPGMSYYRLRQTDFDKSSSTSQIDLVDFGESAVVRTYPNPAGNTLQVISNTAIKKLELINAMGQVVLAETGNDNQQELDVQQLPDGIYGLNVYDIRNGLTRLKVQISHR